MEGSVAKKTRAPRDPQYLANYNAKREEISQAYYKLQKRRPKSAITFNEFAEAGYNRSSVETYFGSLEKLRAFVKEQWPTAIAYEVKGLKNHNTTKKDMLKWYADIYNKIGFTPSREDILNDGRMTIHQIGNHYGGIDRLEYKARETHPDLFKDVSLDAVMTMTRVRKLNESIQKYNKFVITTAVIGSDPHMPFLNGLRTFCKLNKAKLLVLVCEDPGRYKYSGKGTQKIRPSIHQEFLKESVITEDTWLNSNLFISNIKQQAKTIKPVTGVGRVVKKKGSAIFASPKIFLEYNSVRNNKEKLPHFVTSTGAVTKPNYRPESSFWYQGLKTAYMAESDHKLGATYVEVEDDEIFHFTQIECKTDGGHLFFRDKMFKGDLAPKQVRAEAFVIGDLHAGVTDPNAEKVWFEVIEETKPKYIFIHDGFNGTSVNGHMEKDLIARIIRAIENKDDIAAEVMDFALKLRAYASKCDKLYVVPSNHNDWLERYIRKANFFKDGNLKNVPVAIKILQAMLEKKNPLQYAVEELAGIKVPNVVWPGRNEDIIIEGIQCNCHGDVGVNGSRGSLASMVSAYNASVSGHGHRAGILFDAWAVGTSGPLQEDYNNGPGAWTQTSCIIYKCGGRALVNSIGGKWRI